MLTDTEQIEYEGIIKNHNQVNKLEVLTQIAVNENTKLEHQAIKLEEERKELEAMREANEKREAEVKRQQQEEAQRYRETWITQKNMLEANKLIENLF